MVVPERFIAGELVAADWPAERNSERRQVMIERVGYRWLIENGPAARVATDGPATLWRVPHGILDRDEEVAVCEIPSGRIDPGDLPEDILLLDLGHAGRQCSGADGSVVRVPIVCESLAAALAWASDRAGVPEPGR